MRDNTEAMHRLAEATEFATLKMEVGFKDIARRLDALKEKSATDQADAHLEFPEFSYTKPKVT